MARVTSENRPGGISSILCALSGTVSTRRRRITGGKAGDGGEEVAEG